jgi:hypothetical protein
MTKKDNNKIKIYTPTDHYLSLNDKINLSKIIDNEIINEISFVNEIPSKNSFIINMPINTNLLLKHGSNLVFERVLIKVVLDFEII